MELTKREREVMLTVTSIGKQDICCKQIAQILGIQYDTLVKLKKSAMERNGYVSWNGFLADFAKEEAAQK